MSRFRLRRLLNIQESKMFEQITAESEADSVKNVIIKNESKLF